MTPPGTVIEIHASVKAETMAESQAVCKLVVRGNGYDYCTTVS